MFSRCGSPSVLHSCVSSVGRSDLHLRLRRSNRLTSSSDPLTAEAGADGAETSGRPALSSSLDRRAAVLPTAGRPRATHAFWSCRKLRALTELTSVISICWSSEEDAVVAASSTGAAATDNCPPSELEVRVPRWPPMAACRSREGTKPLTLAARASDSAAVLPSFMLLYTFRQDVKRTRTNFALGCGRRRQVALLLIDRLS